MSERERVVNERCEEAWAWLKASFPEVDSAVLESTKQLYFKAFKDGHNSAVQNDVAEAVMDLAASCVSRIVEPTLN